MNIFAKLLDLLKPKRRPQLHVLGDNIDPNELEVLQKCLETGKPVLGNVDENGKLTLKVIDTEDK